MTKVNPATSPSWYAFTVPPGREYVAAYLLTKRFGAFTYVPTETRWRRRNRYCKTKEQMAFPSAPRYVIARFDGPVPWYWIFGMPIITGVVGFDGKPRSLHAGRVYDLMARVPNGRLEIEGVESRLASGKTITKLMKHTIRTEAHAPAEEQFMASGKEFAAGDEVEVIAGPFRERRVTVHEIVGPVAKILLPLFGDEREIDVPVSYLERVA